MIPRTGSLLRLLEAGGLKDIFIACLDGLMGFPQVIDGVYPKTTVQFCVAYGAGEFDRRELEGAQACGEGSEGDIPRRYGGGGGAADGLRGPKGPAVCVDQRAVAEKLPRCDSVFPVPAGDTQVRLYHQCRRIEHEVAQGY